MHFRKSTLACQINVQVGINVKISDEFYKVYEVKMYVKTYYALEKVTNDKSVYNSENKK